MTERMAVSRGWQQSAMAAAAWLRTLAPRRLEGLCYLAVTTIGLIDFTTGLEISLTAIHALPISLAAWFLGAGRAFALAAYSVLMWVGCEMLAGQHYSSWLVPLVNCSLRLSFYIFFVNMIAHLSYLHRHIESVADERARLLLEEMAERERLESEMLQIAEREQRRIGQDLHDGLCQHLTGTALAAFGLAERLEATGAQEAQKAHKVVALVEDGISLARGMAKGLHPVEMRDEGLMQALEEFAATTSEMFNVQCRFECLYPILVSSPSTATHLYRIAQEGVGNAIKHGRARTIVIQLEENEQGLRLAVNDDGQGLAADAPETGGMGLRIMADRAKLMGGLFSVRRRASPGMEISCIIPQAALNA